MNKCRNRGFTLIELLVVIGIIAIISIVVVLVLNPAQLLMQSRDANRLSDLNTVTTALGIYVSQSGGSIGSAGVVYVSIPDPAATSSVGDQCQGLGLISLPGPYIYHCAASSTYRRVDGTGWIPANLASVTGGSSLGYLPVDPLDTSSSRNYYTYTTNGTQYELTAPMESSKYKLSGTNDVITNDGGALATVYEKGTLFGLEPVDYGDTSLVGYWTLDEGTGTAAYDYSGYNATGTWNGSAVGTSGYYSSGKVGPYAGAFDGVTTYLANTGNNTGFQLTTNMTLVAWVKLSASSTDKK